MFLCSSCDSSKPRHTRRFFFGLLRANERDRNCSVRRRMATSSLSERSGMEELGSSSLRPPAVNDPDVEYGACSSRSPNVRAYVASFELHQHRPMCRTDGVGRHYQRHHERPQPPCKTTTAVLKASFSQLLLYRTGSNYCTTSV